MTPRRSPRLRTVALTIGGLVIAVAAGIVVLQGVDLDETASTLQRASAAPLALALLVIAVQAVLRAARWRLLLPLPVGGTHRPAVRRIVPVLLVGYLGNAALPARLGEGVRTALVAARERLPLAETLGSVVLERLLDLLILAVLAVVAAALLGVPDWVVQSALAAIGVSIAALVLAVVAGAALGRWLPRSDSGGALRPIRIALGAVESILRGLTRGGRPRSIVPAGAISVVAWVLDATIYWLVASSLGLELSPLGAMIVSAVTVLSTAIPSAPGYLGTYELAASAGAQALGVPPASALAFALAAHAVTVLPLALAGAIAFLAVGRDLRTMAPPAADLGPSGSIIR